MLLPFRMEKKALLDFPEEVGIEDAATPHHDVFKTCVECSNSRRDVHHVFLFPQH